MASSAGVTRIHPNVFHDVLDTLAAAGWQVRQDSASALTLLVAAPTGSPRPEELGARVSAAVQAAGGARPRVTVRMVDTIPRTALGKAQLVVAATTGAAPSA